MSYERATGSLGNVERGLEAVRTMLLGAGLRVETTDTGLRATGAMMGSRRQPILSRVGRLDVVRDGSRLIVRADLAGVRRLAWFVLVFPIALGGTMALVMWLTLRNVPGRPAVAAFAPLMAVAPWLVLSPLMAWAMRLRVRRALEILVANAEDAGR